MIPVAVIIMCNFYDLLYSFYLLMFLKLSPDVSHKMILMYQVSAL